MNYPFLTVWVHHKASTDASYSFPCASTFDHHNEHIATAKINATQATYCNYF